MNQLTALIAVPIVNVLNYKHWQIKR